MKTSLIIAVLLGALVITACVEQPTGHAVQEQEPVKVGATLALTGSLSFIGQEELRGLQMAAEDINAEGGIDGRRIVIIAQDNKGDAKEAVSTANTLIAVEQVDLLFSAFTHVTGAIKQQVSESGTIMIYASTVPDFARENNRTFRDYNDIGESGQLAAETAARHGHAEVVLITELSDACKTFEQSFRSQAERSNIAVVHTESFKPGEKDLRTQLLKLDSQSADALVACAWRDEGTLMRQLQQIGMLGTPTIHFNAPFDPAADTPEMRRLFEENGAISTWYVQVDESAKHEEFVQRYKERYGSDPRPDALYAYDDLQLYANSLKTCNANTSDKECIVQAMRSTRHEGVSGTLSFDDDRISQRQIALITVRNGTWVAAR